MCDWRNDKSAVVFKTNEPTIEQMVDARRQQQSVLTVQPLLVGGIAPRLPVARNQMNEIFDACDAAFGLDLSHSLFETVEPTTPVDQVIPTTHPPPPLDPVTPP